jgi:hypothetical protein
MKKKLVGLVAAIALAVAGGLLPATVHALPAQTDVTGVITKDFAAVAGAMVEVTCGGTTKTDTTDGSGSYLVTFTTAECPFGPTVKVVAKKGGYSGVGSGTVHGITTKLNIAIVNVSIPEYGWIGGIVAAGAGIGAIAFTRRRFSQQNMAV